MLLLMLHEKPRLINGKAASISIIFLDTMIFAAYIQELPMFGSVLCSVFYGTLEGRSHNEISTAAARRQFIDGLSFRALPEQPDAPRANKKICVDDTLTFGPSAGSGDNLRLQPAAAITH